MIENSIIRALIQKSTTNDDDKKVFKFMVNMCFVFGQKEGIVRYPIDVGYCMFPYTTNLGYCTMRYHTDS